MRRHRWLLWLAAALPAAAGTRWVELKDALVVAPGLKGPAAKAVTMLVEEVRQRTHVHWPAAAARPAAPKPVIEVRLQAGGPPESYRLRVDAAGAAPVVSVTASDARGVLFGAGRLLRTLRMALGSVQAATTLDVAARPRLRIRGHQLGNRPLNNSVDAWTVPMWEQYIRDLAVFGSNAVELIPPYAFLGEETPHFRLPPLDMMAEVSRLLGEYGMDVWIWYPALEKDYSDPKAVEAAVQACAAVFGRLPRIDAIFVPGGDPGHTHPKYLMPYLEKLARALRASHPKAEMWMSPQGFDEEWLKELDGLLKAEPAWLSGIVYGPGVRLSAAQLRAAVPKRYPIRMYPDITHTVRSEYPVPDWDVAYALTYDREPINPRPMAMAEIFRSVEKYSAGFISYSDGTNDDVNKMVWSALAWEPETGVAEILREYGRYFIDGKHGDAFAQGLLALERNWQGPLMANLGVETTLGQFRALERVASPQMLSNWRFQQALYRAYYDAYVRRRLMREAGLEARAMEQLESAPRIGSLAAMAQAEQVLDEAVNRPRFQQLRIRLFELGAALFQSIGMQLSFDLYQANRQRRAASLDTMDIPLNDRPWLRKRFQEIRRLPKESERLKEIDALVNWKNPGPGGYYDDLGDPQRQPHLVMEPESSLPSVTLQEDAPLAWSSYANSSRRAPIKMRYTGLDPEGRYRVRVVYAGDMVSQEQGIRLMADGKFTVHPYMKKPLPIRPVEFDVPAEATEDGELILTWDRQPTPSGRSRGAQVAEVWLIKK